ncbi:MAG: hypothetical protein ABSF79_05800 [Smithellaceae bacterium]|jgi:hypothetical protein
MTMPIIIKNKLLLFALLFLVFLSTTACTCFKNYGKFVPDADVTAAFNKAEINPDLNYYITGSDTYPRSILGLNKAYILDSDLWKKVELKPEELRELSTRMRQRAIMLCRRQGEFGFAVLDEKGKQIGIWYSIMVPGISIKMLDDRKVVIYPPNDSNYMCYDDQ